MNSLQLHTSTRRAIHHREGLMRLPSRYWLKLDGEIPRRRHTSAWVIPLLWRIWSIKAQMALLSLRITASEV